MHKVEAFDRVDIDIQGLPRKPMVVYAGCCSSLGDCFLLLETRTLLCVGTVPSTLDRSSLLTGLVMLEVSLRNMASCAESKQLSMIQNMGLTFTGCPDNRSFTNICDAG